MDNIDKVKIWRANPDLATGLELAKELGVIKKIYSNIDFLFYDLCKAVGIDKDFYPKKTFYVGNKIVIQKQESETNESDDEIILEKFEYKLKIEEYPEILQSKIILKGDLYNKRNELKKKLFATGESNSPDIIKKRQSYIKGIKLITDEIVNIYNDLRAYENNKTIPEKLVVANTLDELIEKDYKINSLSIAEMKVEITMARNRLSAQKKRVRDYTDNALIEKNNKEIEYNTRLIEILKEKINAEKKGS